MAFLLDLAIQSTEKALETAKAGLNDAYALVVTPAGKTLNALFNDNLLFQLSEYYARIVLFLEARIREMASQATPMGATGAVLDLWLELKKVLLPTAQFAQVAIVVTGGNSATLPAGASIATVSGQRYTTDAVVNFPAPVTSIEVTMTAEVIGSESNVAVSDTVFLDPVTDVQNTATVINIITAGADPADEDAKSQLLADSFAGDTGAGTEAWYVAELKKLDGAIAEVFSVPAGFGPGTILFYPLLSLDPLTAPSAGQVSAWEATLRTKRVTLHRLFVLVLATPVVDITFSITPDTPDTQAAVAASVAARFAESYSASGYQISNSDILGAATTAEGVTSATITSITAGAGADANNVPAPGPVADVFALQGQSLLPNVIWP